MAVVSGARGERDGEPHDLSRAVQAPDRYGLVFALLLARSLAVLDALAGQIFLVTLVARLVSVFGTERRRPPENGADQ